VIFFRWDKLKLKVRVFDMLLDLVKLQKCIEYAVGAIDREMLQRVLADPKFWIDICGVTKCAQIEFV
jgi:hypothetical protein